MRPRNCSTMRLGWTLVLAGLGIFTLPALAGTPAAATAAVAGPDKVVAQFDAALVATMKAGKKAGFDGRMAIMQPAVKSAFDFSRTAQVVLGHYWSGFTPQQQQTFTGLLGKLTTVSYATNFDSYANQRFTTTAVRRQGTSAFVSTRFVEPNSGQTHSFDYVLQFSAAGQWKIVNVIADGVSDVAIKRAEYMDLLAKGTFADLVAALQKQIKRARHPD